MHESSQPSTRAYPTRRSLRQAEQRPARGRHGIAPVEQAEPETAISLEPEASLAAPEQLMLLRLPAMSVRPMNLPQASEFVDTSVSKRQKRVLHGASAFGGAAALVLTLTVAGIGPASDSAAAAAFAQQQRFGTGSSPETAYEMLGSVSPEELPEESLSSFVNYTDAAVQYPFAETVGLTDGFGHRDYPIAGFHDAQDFGAPYGTPVQAIADGVVLEAGWTTDGCGWGLKLQHRIDDMDVTSRYCHMAADSHSFKVGDTVKVADQVGLVGLTGITFGAHLHFVIQVDGEAIDPMPFLLKYNRSTRS